MKKLTALVLLAVLLCGCGAGQGAKMGRMSGVKVGICWYDSKEQTGAQLRQSIADGLREKGWQVIEQDAGKNQAVQDEQIQTMIEEKVSVVVLEPVMPSQAGTLEQQLKNAGIAVVFINREPSDERMEQGSWSYVGTQDRQIGQLQAQILLDLPDEGDLNGDGKISYAVLQGPEDHLLVQQITEGCGAGLGPKGNNLLVVSGDWSEQSGRNMCARVLAQYGRDVEVLVCSSDVLAAGAQQAIEEWGWTVGEDVYLVGYGGGPEARQQVNDADLTGTVGLDVQSFVQMVTSAVQDLINGAQPGQIQYAQYLPITAQE